MTQLFLMICGPDGFPLSMTKDTLEVSILLTSLLDGTDLVRNDEEVFQDTRSRWLTTLDTLGHCRISSK